jgi:hypothetical protein
MGNLFAEYILKKSMNQELCTTLCFHYSILKKSVKYVLFCIFGAFFNKNYINCGSLEQYTGTNPVSPVMNAGFPVIPTVTPAVRRGVPVITWIILS